MKIVFGLGNPGKKYDLTPHNIGFAILDHVVEQLGCSVTKKKFYGLYASTQINHENVFFVKPQTYMNLSGKTVAQFCAYFTVSPAEDILIIADDASLPFSTLRFRSQGTSGGHNGLQSIIDCLGSDSFHRLKVGVDQPVGAQDLAGYVLSPFRAEYRQQLAELHTRGSEAVMCWIHEGIQRSMDRFHS